jgi:hypothetical protein
VKHELNSHFVTECSFLFLVSLRLSSVINSFYSVRSHSYSDLMLSEHSQFHSGCACWSGCLCTACRGLYSVFLGFQSLASYLQQDLEPP